ncbi:MAG: VWA domain-containing protein [Desulfobacula sp.]|nr:VWA domain-containing protein [Desulfobacula sp.]
MKSYVKNIFYLIASLMLVAGLFFAPSVSAAPDEQPDYSKEWIDYKSASFQAVGASPQVTGYAGLWHQTSIDNKQNVWYYGQEPDMNFNTGSKNSGALTMQVDLSSASSPTLDFEHKYATEGGSTYDKLRIMVGNDVLWQRTDKQSLDSSGSLGWVSESIDMSKYAGGTVTVTFDFNSVDGVANTYFGWAIYNAQIGSAGSGTGSGTGIFVTGSNLKINQIDNGNFPDVDMYVTVSDQSGSFVSGLTASNFVLKEIGNNIYPLTVQPLSSGGSALSIGITIDKSGSMGSSGMASAKTAVSDFINMSTGAQDEFGIVTFNSTVTTLKNFTTDKADLIAAVDTISEGGSTALYDAIYETLTLTNSQPGIKAVIAFTDGSDNSSSKTETDVIDYAKQLNIPVYTIGIAGASKTILEKIAIQTGGTYSDADFSNLSAIYQSLQTTIMQQYKISFQSKASLSVDRCYDLEATLADGTKYTINQCVYGCSTCNPPVISLHGYTKDMLKSGGAPSFGGSVSIKALVIDNDGDAIAGVQLYYRASGSSNTYTKLEMFNLSSSDTTLYEASVPGSDYSDPGIDFYITASDGTNVKTSKDFTIGTGGTSGSTGSVEQIYIIAPQNNNTMSYGTTSGALTFSFTKVASTSKYVLHLQLKDLLAGTTVPLQLELIPPCTSTGTTGSSFWNPTGTTSGSCTPTPNFTEVLTGVQYLVQLDAAGWDSMAAWDITWGVEAYDSSDVLIGSTFDQQVAAKYVNGLKFIGSTAIALTSPAPGSTLLLTDSAPVFKWDQYTGVAEYEMILAHVSGASFSPVIPFPGLTLTLLTMDSATWQAMPTGNWYWTVLGKDSSGAAAPSGFTIFDLEVQ